MPSAFGVDVGTIQLLLLAVELLLLVATLILLILNRREVKARESLMQHFSSVADVITRQEYFVAVVDAIQRSEKTLVGSVTGSAPTTEEGEVIHQLLASIGEAAKRGVSIRYLLPLAPDRLRMAKLYSARGAEVAFSPSLLMSDARYMCTDDEMVLVGVPEGRGRNQPTRRGYAIPSETVTHLFVADFEAKWNSPDAKSYDLYLTELVEQARAANSKASVKLIADTLGIATEDVDLAVQRARGR